MWLAADWHGAKRLVTCRKGRLHAHGMAWLSSHGKLVHAWTDGWEPMGLQSSKSHCTPPSLYAAHYGRIACTRHGMAFPHHNKHACEANRPAKLHDGAHTLLRAGCTAVLALHALHAWMLACMHAGTPPGHGSQAAGGCRA